MPCCTAERKNHSVDISVQLMGYLRRVRIPGEKGASQGRQEKGAIVTVYVLYCFDARGVIVVRYCFSYCSTVLFYSGIFSCIMICAWYGTTVKAVRYSL